MNYSTSTIGFRFTNNTKIKNYYKLLWCVDVLFYLFFYYSKIEIILGYKLLLYICMTVYLVLICSLTKYNFFVVFLFTD